MNRSIKGKQRDIVITGGGTGGHAFPAIRIGEELAERYGVRVHYIGNPSYIEKTIAEEQGVRFYPIHSQGLEGRHAVEKYGGFAVKNGIGTLQALKWLRQINPSLVVATGGFVSAPVMAAANILGIPYILHEQNSVAGKVNRLFQKKAYEIFTSFDETVGLTKGEVVGNPVRFNRKRTQEGTKLVVLGGSGGSEFLNEMTMTFAKNHWNIPIVLQAGIKHAERLQQENTCPNLEIVGFVDLAERYNEAKVIVARAGTGTLFEIANQGIPAVIVPLPTSADNHQVKNALHFASTGGMKMVEEKEGRQEVVRTLMSVWLNEEERKKMADALSTHALRNSEERIGEHLHAFFRP